MDIDIINWHERNYRTVSVIAAIFVTIAIFYWCYSAHFESSTVFYASALYALILFLIGLFINNSTSKLDEYLTERADAFFRLEKALSLMEFYEGFPKYIDRVLAFQKLTGRSEEDLSRRKSLGDIQFFEAHKKVQLTKEATICSLEKQFLNSNTTLCKQIASVINQFDFENRSSEEDPEKYLSEDDFTDWDDEGFDGNEQNETRYPEIKDALSFSIEEWCKYNRKYDSNADALISYYNSHSGLNQIMAETETLHDLYSRIEKKYSEYTNKARENISWLKKAYGKRIAYEVARLHEISDNVWELSSQLTDLKQVIEGLISETYDLVSDVEQRVNNIEISTEEIIDYRITIGRKLDSIIALLETSNNSFCQGNSKTNPIDV